MLACTVGLVDETKPVEPQDTAVTDTEEDTDTTDTNDTQDSDTDSLPDSENPYNGECGDNLDNDGDGRVDCNDSDCAAAPECNESSDGDTDGDGYPDDDDCDPYNPYVNPGASEIANNGIDDDCDGTIDSGSSGGGGTGGGTGGNPAPGTVCSDTCTDGFGNILYGANDGNCQDGGFGDFVSLALGSSPCAFGTDCSDCGIRTDADGDFHEDDPLNLGLALYSDCDDTDPSVNSSATEVPNNGKDDDCDGTIDNSSSGGGSGTTTETDCTNGADDDADGDVDCDDSDCAFDPACNSSVNCQSGEVEDCIGNCISSSWVGDGTCDENPPYYDLNCADLNYDGGDCSGGSGGTGGSGTALCTDTCSWASDGACDDGGTNSSYSVCSFGTDCADCGSRSPCEDTCSYANDGTCDDDELGTGFSCDRGTDCADCGSY
jgi:hypothetical protein